MSLNRYVGYGLVLLSVLIVMAACEEPGPLSENHIVLEGEDNMRDLGGFVGEGGKTVVHGKLFRSGELSGLTEDDLAVLAALDLDHVIDLRTEKERSKAADLLPDGPVIHHLPLLENMGSDVKLRGKSLEQFIREYMTSLYSTIDSLKIQSWTAIFDVLETGEATVWHCTEGKDRAGMTAALVLLALGVDKADVVEDFMMSNVYLAKSMEKRIRLAERILGEKAEDLLRPLLGVEEGYITAFFDTIDRDYGGTDAFLDLLDVDIQALRDHYLEPSSCSPWKPERRHGFQLSDAY